MELNSNFEGGTKNGGRSDGAKYVGEWKDGKRHGQRTYTWADEKKYIGEWKDDKKHGKGMLTWPDGKEYVGEWHTIKIITRKIISSASTMGNLI